MPGELLGTYWPSTSRIAAYYSLHTLCEYMSGHPIHHVTCMWLQASIVCLFVCLLFVYLQGWGWFTWWPHSYHGRRKASLLRLFPLPQESVCCVCVLCYFQLWHRHLVVGLAVLVFVFCFLLLFFGFCFVIPLSKINFNCVYDLFNAICHFCLYLLLLVTVLVITWPSWRKLTVCPLK